MCDDPSVPPDQIQYTKKSLIWTRIKAYMAVDLWKLLRDLGDVNIWLDDN